MVRLLNPCLSVLSVGLCLAVLPSLRVRSQESPANVNFAGSVPHRIVAADAGIRAEHLAHIEPVVRKGIADGRMPGCVIAAGRSNGVFYLQAFGERQSLPNRLAMLETTVFDMASITKPVATATSIMILWEQGRLRLSDKVAKHLPEFGQHGKDEITIEQLLIHQGGLIPDNALADYVEGKSTAFRNIFALEPYVQPGEKFVYSDVGFIVLAAIVEKLAGVDVAVFAKRSVFEPLRMDETCYLPPEELRERCATTEQRDGKWIRGEVHDPRAHRMGGVAGHAGLFSTAADLSRYARMMLNAGELDGVRVLSQRTVQVMTRAYPVSSGTRGLGWDKQTGYSSNRGENLSESAFGHGGFTGTVLWIDPELDLFYIFLSNRVHPAGKGSVNALAGRIGTIIAASLED
jgi:CubicO group peptidase (beta-lactamase class C family)